jgi:hypothetical protein
VFIGLQSEDAGLFAICPARWCPHLVENIKNMPSTEIDTKAECLDCGNPKENWICLSCYKVRMNL